MSSLIQIYAQGPITVYVDGVAYVPAGTTPPIEPPVHPVDPPPITPPGGAVDISSQAMTQFDAGEGQVKSFFFNQKANSSDECTVVATAGTTATAGWWSVDGAAWQSFTPSGSDFRFQPINGWVSPGVHTVNVKMTGVQGAGGWGIQAVGAGIGY